MTYVAMCDEAAVDKAAAVGGVVCFGVGGGGECSCAVEAAAAVNAL